MTEHPAEPGEDLVSVVVSGESSDPFGTDRALLFTVAYEIPGTASEAEDAVQDGCERWNAADPRTCSIRGRTRRGSWPAALGGSAARDVRRSMAARAAADSPRRGRRRGPRRLGVDGDAACPRDPVTGRAGGVRAAWGCSTSRGPTRRGARPLRARRAPARAPGPRARARASPPLRRRPGPALARDRGLPGRLPRGRPRPMSSSVPNRFPKYDVAASPPARASK